MANVKTAYGAASNLTITLASLASDTNLLAGQASTAVDESSAGNLDELLAGFIANGTTPTAGKEIDVYVYGSIDDVPTYPDGITGTNAANTMTSVNILNSGLKLAASMTITANTGEKNYFGPISVRSLFGGILPKKWGVFVVHNSVSALNATGGNHQITNTPVYETTI